MLWYYAKGKPVDRQELGRPGEFSHLSKKELKAKRLEECGQAVKERPDAEQQAAWPDGGFATVVMMLGITVAIASEGIAFAE